MHRQVIQFCDYGSDKKVSAEATVFGQFGVVRSSLNSWLTVHVATGLRAGNGFEKRDSAVRLAKLLARLDWSKVSASKSGGVVDPDGIVLRSRKHVSAATGREEWAGLEEFVTQEEAALYSGKPAKLAGRE